MTSASTGVLETGTRGPLLQTSSPLRNRPRDHSIKSEICLNGNSNCLLSQMWQEWASMEGVFSSKAHPENTSLNGRPFHFSALICV